MAKIKVVHYINQFYAGIGGEEKADMKEILNTLETAYDYPVDIEYTVNFGEDNSFNINLLQCRPLQVSTNNEAIEMPKDKNVFFR